MNDHQATLLARCLDRIAAGEPIDVILADHPAHRDLLEPHLAAASMLREYDPDPPAPLGDRVMRDIASTPQWDPRRERPATAPGATDRGAPSVNGVGPSSVAAIHEREVQRGRTPGSAVPTGAAAEERSMAPRSRPLDAVRSDHRADEVGSSADAGPIRRTWLLRAASVVAAIGIAAAGMNVASADSRPGDVLWPVRRALDGAQELVVAGVRTVIGPALEGWSSADDPGADRMDGLGAPGDRGSGNTPGGASGGTSGDPLGGKLGGGPIGAGGGPDTPGNRGGSGSAGDGGPTTVARRTTVALGDGSTRGTGTPEAGATDMWLLAARATTATREIPSTLPWEIGEPSPTAPAPAGSTSDHRPGDDHEEPGDASRRPTATPSPSDTPRPAPSSTATQPVPTSPATASPTSPAVCAALITGHVRYADHVPATGATVFALRSTSGMPPGGPPDPGRFPDAPRAVVVGSGAYRLAGLCTGRYFIHAVGERSGRPYAGTHGQGDAPLPVPLTARDMRFHGADITMRPVDLRPPPSPPDPGPGPGSRRGIVPTATPTATPTAAHTDPLSRAVPGIGLPHVPGRPGPSPTSSAPRAPAPGAHRAGHRLSSAGQPAGDLAVDAP